MKILVTGSNGFVGKNLITSLTSKNYEVFSYDSDDTLEVLKTYCMKCDFVVHLAGVNRPKNTEEFYDGNATLLETLSSFLMNANNNCPVLLSSSIQTLRDNDYGKSKLEGENILINHGNKMNSKVLIYRFNNLFGKWSRPNYNSVIATWSYNISRDIPVHIDNKQTLLRLEYIDDVINEIIAAIEGHSNVTQSPYCEVPIHYDVTLNEIYNLLFSFKHERETLLIPNVENGFVKKLYATYLSYLPNTSFSYPLKMNVDDRGSFTEVLKSEDRGQVSINISKPGIVKGQHWHHTKHEKFLVVSGEGIIQLRNIFQEDIIEYNVSGELLEIVDIPPGYTHNIINNGPTDMVTIMWVNEVFDKENPDTYYLEV